MVQRICACSPVGWRMWRVFVVVFGLLFVLGCTVQSADTAPPTPKVQEQDPRPLYQIILEWAVLNTPLPRQASPVFFPDRKLLQEAAVIRVGKENLPPDVKLSLPDKPVQILSEEELQRLADRTGELPALRFTELKASDGVAELGLDLVWFVRKDAQALPLSGGGVRLRFRWQDEAWKFEKRQGLRIS